MPFKRLRALTATALISFSSVDNRLDEFGGPSRRMNEALTRIRRP